MRGCERGDGYRGYTSRREGVREGVSEGVLRTSRISGGIPPPDDDSMADLEFTCRGVHVVVE